MRGAEGGILTIKRAGREDKASSESKDEGETWHTHSAGKTKEENIRHNQRGAMSAIAPINFNHAIIFISPLDF